MLLWIHRDMIDLMCASFNSARRIPPPRPRPSGVFEDTPIARDRYRGITPPRRPPLGDPDYKAKWQDEITKYVNKKIEHGKLCERCFHDRLDHDFN